jgi:hypothetical protein
VTPERFDGTEERKEGCRILVKRAATKQPMDHLTVSNVLGVDPFADLRDKQ